MVRRILLLGSLLAVGLGAPALAAGKQNIDAVLADVQKAAEKKDCDAVLKIVAQQAADSRFSSAPEQTRNSIYFAGVNCAYERQQWDLASRYIHQVIPPKDIPSQFWLLRLGVDSRAKNWDGYISTIEIIARDLPDTLNSFDVRGLSFLLGEIKDRTDLQRRLLKVLSSPAYVPVRWTSTDGFREAYARILVKAGDKQGAAAQVAMIDEPYFLIRISVDPLLRYAVPDNFDIRAAIERHMARMREIAVAHASLIDPQRSVADDLQKLGRPAEALATLEAINPDKSGDDFADKKEVLAWWWDSKANAYRMLGQYEAAVSAFRQGAALNESGQPNISQVLNLAELQLLFGHPVDAMATMEPVASGKVKGSTFGMSVFHAQQACAKFRTGKIDDAKADLSFLRDHPDVGPHLLTKLLLCMGDLDGAAGSIIKQLDTPDQASEALISLSDYDPPLPTTPKDPDEAAFLKLKARADVQAAITRAGGTRKFNISE